jgi:hypothetical protein
MAAESTVLRQAWLAVARWSRLFRLNSGMAWVGKAERRPDGSVLLHGARPIAIGFGLPNGRPLAGPSDLIGYTEVEITPDMVGRHVPVFTGIETKETGGGRQREEQINFIEQVTKAGGIAGFANTPEAAQSIIRGWARAVGAKLVETLPANSVRGTQK